MKKIGALIKQKRIEVGLNQSELAAKIGVNVSTISRWETGNIANMKRNQVAKLSENLGIPVIELMGWNSPKSEDDSLIAELTDQVKGFSPEDKRHIIEYAKLYSKMIKNKKGDDD